MHIDHHPLAKDFPESPETLQRLRQDDKHFARQADEYEALDKHICRIEDGVELLGEAALKTLKQQRVALKDELERQLKQASGACCGGCGG